MTTPATILALSAIGLAVYTVLVISIWAFVHGGQRKVRVVPEGEL